MVLATTLISENIEDSHTHDLRNPSSETDEVRNALIQLKAKGIKDWEILDIWSKIIYEQGNYAMADTLESVAHELGKPVE